MNQPQPQQVCPQCKGRWDDCALCNGTNPLREKLEASASALPNARSVVAENIDHPAHYGGDTVYEAIKVIEAWRLGFCLGNALKYICRAGKKGSELDDLRKAKWYIDREISRRESE